MDYCETCVYYPPSSCDGKPCTQCDITNPFLTCYREKEFVIDFYQGHKQTNADRIRSMTDEELAEMLNHIQGDGFLVGIGRRKMSAYGNWLEWLKQERENE